MRQYQCLNSCEWKRGNYNLTSLRDEDKYLIMNWRNEQIDILRQKEILTKTVQEQYFNNVVDQLFLVEHPRQILFSFFYKNIFIGYGGFVHIDWESMNSEISFLIYTTRNRDEGVFVSDFKNYLSLLTDIAFKELNFIKLYTTVYDIPERKLYITVVKEFGFEQEAKLEKHILINSQLRDQFIYSYFKK